MKEDSNMWRYKLSIGLFVVLVLGVGRVHAMVDPVLIKCMERGYTIEERIGTQPAQCVFPDGSSCLISDFNAGRYGDKFMSGSVCIPQGKMTVGNGQCCNGLVSTMNKDIPEAPLCLPKNIIRVDPVVVVVLAGLLVGIAAIIFSNKQSNKKNNKTKR
jgi:hypothetical protein